ncbi:class I adenylate-forming enzyme family protein [Actinotalea sp. JY-7876]|uniref:class I adenylate-forming enzyme family protein n=2 Tax=unclassified Actinotalea TaxID=2638618 RepID=UPI0015F5293E|nr:AMP-binding protein [Actinotalea sp. JY-7876]
MGAGARGPAQVARGLAALVAGDPVGTFRLVRALRPRSFEGVLRAAAARRPDVVAMVDDLGAVGAAELDAAADALARSIARALAPPVPGAGSRRPRAARPRVGIVAPDDRRFVVAVAATLRAGADAVLIGPRSGELEVSGVVERERVVALLRVPAEASGPWALTRTSVVTSRDGRREAGRRDRAPRVVLLTAGTTGAPVSTAGSPSTARLVPQLALLAATGVRAGRPVLVLPPLFHGHGFGVLTAGLLVGAPVVTAGERSGAGICAAARRYGAAVVTGVPVHLQRLADHLAAGCPDAPRLHRVVSGSAGLRPDVAARLARQADGVVDLFGSTGTGTLTVATTADLAAAPGCVGRPVAGVRVAVVDDAGREVPRGTSGLLVAVERGRLVPTGGGRLVPTGDRAVLDRAGRVRLAGRADAVVVSGGENVHPGEVEAFLVARPGVRDAVVGAVPDAVHGTRLVADVVLDAAGPLTPASAPQELRTAVRALLAPHKVPREVRVVDELDRSAVGKARLRS